MLIVFVHILLVSLTDGYLAKLNEVKNNKILSSGLVQVLCHQVHELLDLLEIINIQSAEDSIFEIFINKICRRFI
jgi:hypothetical protein